ncbi:MAG: 2-oxoglutarate dehydrogenase complex dihydrolipoyllysine-residue succinyltransferase [Salinivirgaceae bacterium]|nr:2-oxoglutarate dehydrogenase complex dihydrolipoyllysine-residue succinyltransferase [Salinivirgaceae bacterium]
MIIEVKIPSPGESISTVEIAQWLVSDGDLVTKNQDLAEIESEKATLTIVSPADGQVKIVAKERVEVAVNSIACTIDDSKAAAQDKPQTDKKPAKVEQTIASSKEPEGIDIKITPLAKKMMEQNNIQPQEVINRLTAKHVTGALQMPGVNAAPKPEGERSMERKPMSNLRKKVSERLVAVKNQTAMLTTFNEIDMTNLMQLRKKYQSQFQEKHGVKLGFMSFFTKAATLALKAFPSVNAMIDGDDIVYFKYSDIGIAVQTPRGLMVPVIRDTGSKDIATLESDIVLLANKARKGVITLDELKGGTFTITNGGVFGSLLSTPILNPPQTGILGMHTIQDRPIAVNGQVVIRPMMYVALSYDHRVIDGSESVGFLLKVKTLIENPYQMLAQSANAEEELLGL